IEQQPRRLQPRVVTGHAVLIDDGALRCGIGSARDGGCRNTGIVRSSARDGNCQHADPPCDHKMCFHAVSSSADILAPAEEWPTYVIGIGRWRRLTATLISIRLYGICRFPREFYPLDWQSPCGRTGWRGGRS